VILEGSFVVGIRDAALKNVNPQVQDIAVRYVINNAISKFTVHAFAGGLLSAFGHDPLISISGFSGEINLLEDIDQSQLLITVQSASLKLVSQARDKDRVEIERTMNDEVLESGRFPEITYRCSSIASSKTGEGQYWSALSGELSLHGVTRNLTVPSRVYISEETLKASGSFSILQSDYGIKLVSVAGGSLKVKDEVKFVFDMVARKQS
jgi:polyisoprenoid-binding protein YceI